MQDRVPTKPNRYAVYDENHNFLRYEYHERADEPTQVGDALNKANLLPDAVATALGLTGNPQVKDALGKIKALIDGNTTLANGKAKIATVSYTGTGASGEDNPCVLTFPFPPKLLMQIGGASIRMCYRSDSSYMPYPAIGAPCLLTTSYAQGLFIVSSGGMFPDTVRAKKSADGKTISWYYSGDNAAAQFNENGVVYDLLIIG